MTKSNLNKIRLSLASHGYYSVNVSLHLISLVVIGRGQIPLGQSRLALAILKQEKSNLQKY